MSCFAIICTALLLLFERNERMNEFSVTSLDMSFPVKCIDVDIYFVPSSLMSVKGSLWLLMSRKSRVMCMLSACVECSHLSLSSARTTRR